MDNLLIALKVSMIGISVVFVALVLVGACIHLLSRLEKEPEEANPVGEDRVDDEIVAAISAAVIVALGPKVRIRHIRHGSTSTEGTWSRQGRVTIMASHRTRN